MDLAKRKYRFIEQFMQIINIEKIERLENIMNEELNHSDDVVAYTVQGKPLTKDQYIDKVKNADKAIDRGEFTTVEDLEKEVENW